MESSSGFRLPNRGEPSRSTPHPGCVGPVRRDGAWCCRNRSSGPDLSEARSREPFQGALAHHPGGVDVGIVDAPAGRAPEQFPFAVLGIDVSARGVGAARVHGRQLEHQATGDLHGVRERGLRDSPHPAGAGGRRHPASVRRDLSAHASALGPAPARRQRAGELRTAVLGGFKACCDHCGAVATSKPDHSETSPPPRARRVVHSRTGPAS